MKREAPLFFVVLALFFIDKRDLWSDAAVGIIKRENATQSTKH